MLQRLAKAFLLVGLLAALLCSQAVVAPAEAAPRHRHAPSRSLPQANPMSFQVVNLANRSWHYRWATRMNVLTASSGMTSAPTLLNTLDIASTCGDCKTVGISIQFNIVERSLGTITSESTTTSENTCTFGTCVSMGLAVQYTVIVDQPRQVAPKVQRLMARSVRLMRAMFPNHRVNVARVLAGFNKLARLLVPGAPVIVLATPSSFSGQDTPGNSPSIVVALVS